MEASPTGIAPTLAASRMRQCSPSVVSRSAVPVRAAFQLAYAFASW